MLGTNIPVSYTHLDVYKRQQKDMTPFYRECSCFLYPSYYPEGMSNVLLEAAASGRPVIAADRAGCRETLDDGVTGFLVPVNDEKAAIEATEKILRMSSEEPVSYTHLFHGDQFQHRPTWLPLPLAYPGVPGVGQQPQLQTLH